MNLKNTPDTTPSQNEQSHPFNIRELYAEYRKDPNSIPDYETFLHIMCKDLGQKKIQWATLQIGQFLRFEQKIYADSFVLDTEMTASLPDADTYSINSMEYILAYLGETPMLMRLKALQELAQMSSKGIQPHRSELYHSTTCAITDGLIKYGALLSASSLREYGLPIRSGEALISIDPKVGLPHVYAGNGPEEQFMNPRWFSLEERGLGFLFNLPGLTSTIKRFTRPLLNVDNTYGIGIAPLVPVNDTTIKEINYDIDAKHYALEIAKELGLEKTLLISLQARKLFFTFVRSRQFSDMHQFSDYLEEIVSKYNDSADRKVTPIDIPKRKQENPII